MQKRTISHFMAVMLTILSASCTTPKPVELSALTLPTLPASGDAASGKTIFESGVFGKDLQPCSTCHAIEGPKESGPTLKGIGTTAESRVPNQNAEAYLFNSIVNPNLAILSGYSAGVMPADYAQKLSPQQIRDLITYLLTLR